VENESWQKAVVPPTVTENGTEVSPVRGAGCAASKREPSGGMDELARDCCKKEPMYAEP